MSRPAAVLACAIAGLVASSSFAAIQREYLSWVPAQQQLIKSILESNAGIADLAIRARNSKPADAQQAMLKLTTLLEAGMPLDAIDALFELQALTLCPDDLMLPPVFELALGELDSPELAQAVLEIFDEYPQGDVSKLTKLSLARGWTVAEVDRWLAGRAPGHRSIWVQERLRFNIEHGSGVELTRSLLRKIRASPEDFDGALEILQVLEGAHVNTEREWDLSWLPGVLKPAKATQAQAIAECLEGIESWATAVEYQRLALSIPLTEDELVHRVAWRPDQGLSKEQWSAIFEASVREQMSECLLKLGRNGEAQKAMVAAADVRKSHGLPKDAYFSGRVQSITGGRTIERRIKAQESTSKDDPRYWIEREAYYRGRQETAQQEDAINHALALTERKPGAKAADESARFGPVNAAAWFYLDHGRGQAAATLLRREMAESDPKSELSKCTGVMLGGVLRDFLNPGDEVPWAWLARREAWGDTEQRVLARLIGSTGPAFLDRAEWLAGEGGMARELALGSALRQVGETARAVPHLIAAAGGAQSQEDRTKAWQELFSCYTAAGNWEAAERAFPHLPQGGMWDAAERLSRLALSAARAGATVQAMRIWTKAANLRPAQVTALPELARAGLRADLVRFYLEMQARMPTSVYPAKALRKLGE